MHGEEEGSAENRTSVRRAEMGMMILELREWGRFAGRAGVVGRRSSLMQRPEVLQMTRARTAPFRRDSTRTDLDLPVRKQKDPAPIPDESSRQLPSYNAKDERSEHGETNLVVPRPLPEIGQIIHNILQSLLQI